ncbi:MAG TPA: hypothetical protein VHM24_07800 [Gemmatimonadaceae bacterium]|nr:hypothetical protein [Gemmatimonadaceae bacterium]
MLTGFRRASLVGAAMLTGGCSRDSITSPDTAGLGPSPANQSAVDLPVATLDQLYAAVNDPSNAGKRVVVAPGKYLLDSTYPNGGRIQLQKDMTLSGLTGHPGAVTIDASNLSAAALTDGALVTGAIRVGRGSNTVEWLSVRNAVKGAAGITTDLFLPGRTVVTIAHVVVSGSPRGFDIRNTGSSAAGRLLEVVLSDNEVVHNLIGTGQGMRIANLLGADGARIHATLDGNYSHGNIAGLLAANQGVSSASVAIESHEDRFEGNGNGIVLLGGIIQGTVAASRNLTRFSATGTHVTGNTGQLGTTFPARFGIGVYGGVRTGAVAASDNTAELNLTDVGIADNGGPDIAAWGAISSTTVPAGTGNLAMVRLFGSSINAGVVPVGSDPAEPAGTNRVVVVRGV